MDRTTIILLVSALVAALTRAFNEDLPIFKNVSKPVRAVLAAALGIVSAVVDNLSTQGSTLQSAIVTAVSVSGPSFLLLVIEVIGGGGPVSGARASAEPGAMRSGFTQAPPYSTKIVGLLFVLPMLLSCAVSLEAQRAGALRADSAFHAAGMGSLAPDSAECVSLDSQHRTWGAVAEIAGVLAGAGGISMIPISNDDKTARVALATSAVVLGAVAAVAVYVEQDAASSWARDCTVGSGK